MPATLSRLIQTLQPSATLEMAAKAKQLRAAGNVVYDLSVGEPDFTTPRHICDAATRAMQAGHTHYTVASGIPELKEAVAQQYRQRHGLDYSPQQIVISNGAKHALHNVLTVLLDPDDEVIIPAPYWVSYSELVKLAGAKPVIVSTEQDRGFKLTPEQLRQAITEKAKILILCSPSNPTGSMYTRNELEQLADVALDADLLVVADEVYEHLVYKEHPFTSFATVRPELPERTMLVGAVSKTYAMTGWRIGWTMAPEHVARAMGSLQGQQTSNPSSISQHAALAALTGPQDCVAEMLAEFTSRRNFVLRRIGEIPGLSSAEIAGAFYAFIHIGPHLHRDYNGVWIENSQQWCLELLARQKVATVMGSAFGTEGYVRASFATGMENLVEAFDRIEAFVTR